MAKESPMAIPGGGSGRLGSGAQFSGRMGNMKFANIQKPATKWETALKTAPARPSIMPTLDAIRNSPSGYLP